MGLIPYRCIKWLGGRAIEANKRRLEEPRRNAPFQGMILLTAGEVPDRLVFAGTETTNVFMTCGIIKTPGLIGMTATEFKGSLTLGLGYGPTALVTGIFDHIMEILPERRTARASDGAVHSWIEADCRAGATAD